MAFASKWQVAFNSVFKGLKLCVTFFSLLLVKIHVVSNIS